MFVLAVVPLVISAGFFHLERGSDQVIVNGGFGVNPVVRTRNLLMHTAQIDAHRLSLHCELLVHVWQCFVDLCRRRLGGRNLSPIDLVEQFFPLFRIAERKVDLGGFLASPGIIGQDVSRGQLVIDIEVVRHRRVVIEAHFSRRRSWSFFGH